MKYHKLGYCLQGDVVKEHSHPPVFKLEEMGNGEPRLIVGVPSGDTLVIRSLIDVLEPPYHALYVLHTPRGEGEAGRYQSPELDRSMVASFLNRFSDYLAGDGRFDLWVYSLPQQATLAWDRHNLLYAYGPVPKFISALSALGFVQGNVGAAFEHMHYYRKELDKDAADMLNYFSWVRTPLKPIDEQ